MGREGWARVRGANVNFDAIYPPPPPFSLSLDLYLCVSVFCVISTRVLSCVPAAPVHPQTENDEMEKRLMATVVKHLQHMGKQAKSSTVRIFLFFISCFRHSRTLFIHLTLNMCFFFLLTLSILPVFLY